jgi:integrase
MRQHLTARVIEGLKPKDKRYNVVDTEVRGLGVQVQPSGTKSFFHVRKIQGWPERTHLGEWPEYTLDLARGKAGELNGKLAKWRSDDYAGANPIVKPKSVPTLGEVLEHYIDNHLRSASKNGERAVKYARWQFDAYLAAWRNRPLGTIRRENVRERHGQIAKDHGAVTANRVTTFLRTIINHAIHPDVALWDGINPAKDPKKFLAAEGGRDRTLQQGEWPKFFEELKNERNPDLRDGVLLALFTGQRRGSILKMRWQDLDLRRGLWTVTAFKGRKGKKPHIVPLIDEALTVLRRRPRVDNSEWVFVGRNGALTTLEKPWLAFRERLGLTKKNGEARLVFHDLRRSAATAAGDTGASTEVIQKTLGHVDDSMATLIYDQSDRRPAVRKSMSRAAELMLAHGKTSTKKLLATPRQQEK